MKKQDIVLFLGPPGSGKGTLSNLCVKRLGWRQLSTGNLCREHIAQGTEVGQKIDFDIKSGKLISDLLVMKMVDEWLASVNPEHTVIFDGFPRTVPQAHALHELVSSRDDRQLNVVQLSIPDEELMYRLLARRICENDKCQQVYSLHKLSALGPLKEMICNECESKLVRRPDDQETSIAERLRIYHEHEKGLLTFYKEKGHNVKSIEAGSSLEDVFAKFLDIAGYTDA